MIKTKDLSQWYLDSIFKAKLVDYAPVRGCMIIRPNGFAVWELIQAELDKRIKKSGAQNAYFPLFIPQSFLEKEKEHVEGFSPELAVVTHAGGSELEEPLAVRPTSETMFYTMYAKWIKSHRDLPLKINQWANVVRWEMRTRPFLRTSEFLWQEGHTAHRTEEEADETALHHLKLYEKFYRNYLAIPAITGKKTESEKFAGAKTTYTLEPMMKDGKALQMGTSHLLAHSFPESFDIQYQDKDGQVKTPWCTSWGTTTRMIGALIMVHGDERGIVLPPKVAPVQVAIVPIFKPNNKDSVLDYTESIKADLETAQIRVKVFADDTKSPGARFFECEELGIPVRIEVGPRDLENNNMMLATRINLSDDGVDDKPKKVLVGKSQVVEFAQNTLSDMQAKLLERAEKFMHSNIHQVSTFDQLSNELDSKGGFFKVNWCASEKCESKLKEIKASMRVVLEDPVDSNCFVCNDNAEVKVITARSY